MIRIDRLSIALPPNLRHRAGPIADQIGRSLASGPHPEGADGRVLSGIEVRCSMHRQNGDIGRAISDAIRGGLAKRGEHGD